MVRRRPVGTLRAPRGGARVAVAAAALTICPTLAACGGHGRPPGASALPFSGALGSTPTGAVERKPSPTEARFAARMERFCTQIGGMTSLDGGGGGPAAAQSFLADARQLAKIDAALTRLHAAPRQRPVVRDYRRLIPSQLVLDQRIAADLARDDSVSAATARTQHAYNSAYRSRLATELGVSCLAQR